MIIRGGDGLRVSSGRVLLGLKYFKIILRVTAAQAYISVVKHNFVLLLVLLVYKVTIVFHKVNAASSRVTTAERVTTAGWIKTKIA
ncbi:hypothetical protein Tco_0381944 [Tanacetum coccineum]